ncbi:MAG: MATE family efflux transporter [Oscillospiraceae bacterium]|nr:MATE family efflux transporter [Oscillospiraceae bacterium]
MIKKTGGYEMDMCSGSILKKMLLFALPLMLSSILQLLFNAADIVVVGKFAGDNSLAAVGSTTALINLLTNLFLGMSVGANVAAARFFGGKSEMELSRTVHTSMALSAISGLILTAVGLVLAKKMLVWMQTPAEVCDLAAVYLRIYFAGAIPNMVYNFGSALLRAIGDTKRPLYYLLLAGIINVVLNLFFVIVFNMDVAGVALATVISQMISAALVVRCLMKESGGIQFSFKKLCIDRSILGIILRIGLPAGFQGVIFSLSNVVIQSSINIFGNIVVAGNSAAGNIEGFVYMAMNAFHQATISFVSQNYGAGLHKRINRIVLTGLGCVTVTGLLLGNIAVFFGEPLLGIYSDNPEVITAGMVRLLMICTLYALCGIMDVMVGALRGIGYSIIPTIVSLVGVCGLRLLWIATVFQIPEYHCVEMIYLSYPITWIITIAANTICFLCVRKHAYRKVAPVSTVK